DHPCPVPNNVGKPALPAQDRRTPRAKLQSIARFLELGMDDPRLDAEVRNNLAWLIVRQAPPNAPQLMEALELSRLAVEASRGRVAAYTDTLSEVYLRLGVWSQALRWAEASLRLEPNNVLYRRQVKRVEARLRSYAQPGGRVRLDAQMR
ncbi:MAG: hypothetical protein AAFX99_33135, partial [Myxococcota bacterium]